MPKANTQVTTLAPPAAVRPLTDSALTGLVAQYREADAEMDRIQASNHPTLTKRAKADLDKLYKGASERLCASRAAICSAQAATPRGAVIQLTHWCSTDGIHAVEVPERCDGVMRSVLRVLSNIAGSSDEAELQAAD